MLTDLTSNPLVAPLFSIIVPALIGYIVVLIAKRKQRTESDAAQLKQRDELVTIKQQMEIDTIRQQSAIAAIRMEGELAEARQTEIVRINAERLRTETVQARKILVENIEATNEKQRITLEASTKEQRDSMAEQTKILHNIAIVQDQTHVTVNGAKTALETTLQGVRNELKEAQTSAAAAATIAAMALQTANELARRDLTTKEAQIAYLQQQLVNYKPVAVAVPGISHNSPLAEGMGQVVHVPAQVLPVEEATKS